MQGNAQYLHTERGRDGHARPGAERTRPGQGMCGRGGACAPPGRATGLQSRAEAVVQDGGPRWSFEARMRGFQKVLVKNPTSAFPLAQISRSSIHFVTGNRRSRKFRPAQDPLRGCQKHAFAGQMTSTFSESRIRRAFDRQTPRDGSPSGGSRSSRARPAEPHIRDAPLPAHLAAGHRPNGGAHRPARIPSVLTARLFALARPVELLLEVREHRAGGLHVVAHGLARRLAGRGGFAGRGLAGRG